MILETEEGIFIEFEQVLDAFGFKLKILPPKRKAFTINLNDVEVKKFVIMIVDLTKHLR